MRRITQLLGLLEQSTRGNELPQKKSRLAILGATEEQRADIIPDLADLFQLLGQRQCKLQLASV